jgi:hypothetical protein
MNAEKTFRKSGIALAVLNLLAIINGANYFLFQAKFPVFAWLMFNICAPSVMLYLIGYFTKRREIMTASIPFLAFFGTGGLFTFGWTGFAIISQVGHILMTLAVIFIITTVIKEKKWKLPAAGFIIGLIIFLIILPFHQKYVKSHPEYIKKLGDPKFEEIMKSK